MELQLPAAGLNGMVSRSETPLFPKMMQSSGIAPNHKSGLLCDFVAVRTDLKVQTAD